MIEPAALLAWTALAVAATMSPGPDTVLVVSHAARGGLRAGLAAAAGIVAGVVWYALLVGFGALSILVATPILFATVKIVGALYLTWIGASMIWRAWRGEVGSTPAAAVELSQPFMQAFLTNALNPKVAVFYLAALPQFTSGERAPLVGMLLIAIHYATAAIWMPFLAVAGSRARAITWNSTFVRWLEGVVGAFFVGVAGRLAFAPR